MAYSILGFSKVKNIASAEKHNERFFKKSSNKDIDLERSKFNYDLVRTDYDNSLEKIIEKRILNGHSKKNKNEKVRKIRTDAVKSCELMMTASPEFFKDISKEKQEYFFKCCLEFSQEQFGKDNIVMAKVHLDETSPHMHLIFVPLKDGKLNAREVAGGLEKYRERQTAFNEYLNSKGFDLSRGDKNTFRKHQNLKDFKNSTRESVEELENKIRELEEKEKAIRDFSKEFDRKKALEKRQNQAKSELKDCYISFEKGFGDIPANYSRIKMSGYKKFTDLNTEIQNEVVTKYLKNWLSDLTGKHISMLENKARLEAERQEAKNELEPMFFGLDNKKMECHISKVKGDDNSAPFSYSDAKEETKEFLINLKLGIDKSYKLIDRTDDIVAQKQRLEAQKQAELDAEQLKREKIRQEAENKLKTMFFGFVTNTQIINISEIQGKNSCKWSFSDINAENQKLIIDTYLGEDTGKIIKNKTEDIRLEQQASRPTPEPQKAPISDFKAQKPVEIPKEPEKPLKPILKLDETEYNKLCEFVFEECGTHSWGWELVEALEKNPKPIKEIEKRLENIAPEVLKLNANFIKELRKSLSEAKETIENTRQSPQKVKTKDRGMEM